MKLNCAACGRECENNNQPYCFDCWPHNDDLARTDNCNCKTCRSKRAGNAVNGAVFFPKAVAVALALFALIIPAVAQVNNPGVQQDGPIVIGHGAKWTGKNKIGDTGLPVVTGPGGTNGQVQYNNSGVFGGLTNAQLTALINPATAALSGALPAWPNNTTTFFRGDGTYATLNFAALGGSATCAQLPALTGGVTSSAGSCVTLLGAGVVADTNVAAGAAIAVSKLGNIPANSMLSNWTAGAAPGIGNTIPACANDGAHALVYINGTGLQCATLTTGGTMGSVTVAGTSAIAATGTCTSTTTINCSLAQTNATKAQQETGTSTAAVVVPNNQQNHDSAAKAWAYINGTTGALLSGYNISSSRTGAGTFSFTFTTAFATANYSCVSQPIASLGGATFSVTAAGQTTTTVAIATFTTANTLTDPTNLSIVCYGRQ